MLARFYGNAWSECSEYLKDLTPCRTVCIAVVYKENVVNITGARQFRHARTQGPFKFIIPIVAFLGWKSVSYEELIFDYGLRHRCKQGRIFCYQSFVVSVNHGGFDDLISKLVMPSFERCSDIFPRGIGLIRIRLKHSAS